MSCQCVVLCGIPTLVGYALGTTGDVRKHAQEYHPCIKISVIPNLGTDSWGWLRPFGILALSEAFWDFVCWCFWGISECACVRVCVVVCGCLGAFCSNASGNNNKLSKQCHCDNSTWSITCAHVSPVIWSGGEHGPRFGAQNVGPHFLSRRSEDAILTKKGGGVPEGSAARQVLPVPHAHCDYDSQYYSGYSCFVLVELLGITGVGCGASLLGDPWVVALSAGAGLHDADGQPLVVEHR